MSQAIAAACLKVEGKSARTVVLALGSAFAADGRGACAFAQPIICLLSTRPWIAWCKHCEYARLFGWHR